MRKITYLLLILFIVFISFFIFNKLFNKKKENDEIQNKLAILNNIDEQLDYFNYDYLDRYISYYSENKNKSIKQIIVEVNIGLDQKFYTNTKETPYLNQSYILINKYLFMSENYVPNNLEVIDEKYSRSGMRLVNYAKEAFETLCKDANSEGYKIRAISSYRSYNYQFDLYNRYVLQDGIKKADTYSARAGFSEHQTGLVVDVDNEVLPYTSFHETKEYSWMNDNAHKYGFIERYPTGKESITGYDYESWHYRYVGVEIATYIKENNIAFDEYYVQFIEHKK